MTSPRCPVCGYGTANHHPMDHTIYSKGMTAKIGRKLVKAAAVELNLPVEAVASYIDEAEHQDGYGYWRQFDRFTALRDDFKLYAELSAG